MNKTGTKRNRDGSVIVRLQRPDSCIELHKTQKISAAKIKKTKIYLLKGKITKDC